MDLPLVAVFRVQVVHPVETAKQRRFAAPGGTDQGGHFVLIDRQRYAVERTGISVIIEIQVFDLDFGRWRQRLYLHFKMTLPAMVSMSMKIVMTRAAPHAWECQLL